MGGGKYKLLSVIFWRSNAYKLLFFFNVCHISLNNAVQLVICLWNIFWNIWNCVSGHTEIQNFSFLGPLPPFGFYNHNNKYINNVMFALVPMNSLILGWVLLHILEINLSTTPCIKLLFVYMFSFLAMSLSEDWRRGPSRCDCLTNVNKRKGVVCWTRVL
jgi:hypothetical protein